MNYIFFERTNWPVLYYQTDFYTFRSHNYRISSLYVVKVMFTIARLISGSINRACNGRKGLDFTDTLC